MLAFATMSWLSWCLLGRLCIGFLIRISIALQVGLGTLPLDLFGHCLSEFEAFAELDKFCCSMLTGIKTLIDHVLLPGRRNAEFQNLHNVVVIETLVVSKRWKVQQTAVDLLDTRIELACLHVVWLTHGATHVPLLVLESLLWEMC